MSILADRSAGISFYNLNSAPLLLAFNVQISWSMWVRGQHKAMGILTVSLHDLVGALNSFFLPTIEKNIRFKVIILAEMCGVSNCHKHWKKKINSIISGK
jgi:hypothetical protein